MALSTKAAAFSIDALLSRDETSEAVQLNGDEVDGDPPRKIGPGDMSAYPILDAALSKPLSQLHLHETRTFFKPQSDKVAVPTTAITSVPSTQPYDFVNAYASIESRLRHISVRHAQSGTAVDGKPSQDITASPANALPIQQKTQPMDHQLTIPSFKIHPDVNVPISLANSTTLTQEKEVEEALIRRYSMPGMSDKPLAVEQWVKSTLEFGRQDDNRCVSENDLPVSQIVNGIKVTLVNSDLWKKFNRCGTEMILNRAGRRMFPCILISIEGLDDSAWYSIRLHIASADGQRYKFINCKWLPVGKADNEVDCTHFEHPDSPNIGSFWMKGNISFSKLKITNNKENSDKNMVLNSMHKYIPHVLISREGNSLSDVTQTEVSCFSFSETKFIAVTAYQNEQITQLKIKNNPFAKAFRDADVAMLLQGAHGFPPDAVSGDGYPLQHGPRRGSSPDYRPHGKLTGCSANESSEIRRRSLPYTIPQSSFLRPPPSFANAPWYSKSDKACSLLRDSEGSHPGSSACSSQSSLGSQESGFGEYPFAIELPGKGCLTKSKATDVCSERHQQHQHQPQYVGSSPSLNAADMYWAHSPCSRLSLPASHSLSALAIRSPQLSKRRSETTNRQVAFNLSVPLKRSRSVSPARDVPDELLTK